VLGSRQIMAADQAAFINSAMIRHLDFNDSWHGGHPSDMTGALFALAEAVKADGRRFLTAMVLSYEVMLRMIRAGKLGERGWDQGFAVGIGTVCGVGNLLGLPAASIANAIGMIAAANVSLRVTRSGGNLSNWKGVATPFACRNAVFTTLLAAQGLTGPDSPFEGRHGLFQQITGPFDPEPFGSEAGPWLTSLIRFKYWPAELHSQAGIWAALKLRERMTIEDIASIAISTYHFAWFEIGSGAAKWDPKSSETADHSLPYIFVRTMLDGKITIRSYDEKAYSDPALRPLMAKITVLEDPEIEARYPGEITMRVEAVGKDGRHERIEIKDPRGDARNPMNEADVDAKFHSMADAVIGAERATAAIKGWRGIDKAASLTPLLDLLVV
jgi:2-methylcitrate dehydratase